MVPSLTASLILPSLQLLALMLVTSRAAAGILELIPRDESQHQSVGDSFFISCSPKKTKHQHRLMWTGPDGSQIRQYSGRMHVEEATSDSKGLNLILENISRNDAGQYTCSANLDGEEINKSFVMHVHSKTSFEGTELHQSIEEGTDSDIICRAEGDPPPKIRWRKQRAMISLNTGKFSESKGPPHVLTVHNVSFDDAGMYTCNSVQVSTHMSDVKDVEINVTVHHAPRLTPAADSYSFGFIGGTVNLSCTARAVPYANFTWHKDGQLIRPGGHHNEDPEEDTWLIEGISRVDSIGRSANSQRYSGRQYDNHHQQQNMNGHPDGDREHGDPHYTILAVNYTTSFLEINISDASVFGKYECRANNPLGSDTRTLELRLGKQPPVPMVKVKKGGTGTHSLILSLRVVEDEGEHEQKVKSFRVQYKKAGDEWSEAVEFQKGRRYRLTRLQPATLYVLRVASRNVAGLSRYSEHQVQKTKPMPVAQVRTSKGSQETRLFLPVLLLALSSLWLFSPV